MDEKRETANDGRISASELLELCRWNTPSVYNGWEQITSANAGADGFNLEEVRDFMPHMGPMAGFAVTIVIEPSNPAHRQEAPDAWREYRHYVGSVPGPKIAVVQDLDKPGTVGAFWGEVNSNTHHALGCVGTITDGAVRDLDEMCDVGFKALARRLCVGHAHCWPVRWNCEVEVFGRKVAPGQLIHADKHGFLAVPAADETRLLEATRFMDANECRTVIGAARQVAGKSLAEIHAGMDAAGSAFKAAAGEKFSGKGEWQ